jgi:hypothetical protein
VERGEIRRIEAVYHRCPHGMGSGWSSWQDAMSTRARWTDASGKESRRRRPSPLPSLNRHPRASSRGRTSPRRVGEDAARKGRRYMRRKSETANPVPARSAPPSAPSSASSKWTAATRKSRQPSRHKPSGRTNRERPPLRHLCCDRADSPAMRPRHGRRCRAEGRGATFKPSRRRRSARAQTGLSVPHGPTNNRAKNDGRD